MKKAKRVDRGAFELGGNKPHLVKALREMKLIGRAGLRDEFYQTKEELIAVRSKLAVLD